MFKVAIASLLCIRWDYPDYHIHESDTLVCSLSFILIESVWDSYPRQAQFAPIDLVLKEFHTPSLII